MEKSRILVVEDDAALRKIMEYQLEAAGYSVLTACDGEEGLKVAREQRPDLIMLDVMMPRMDGYEACREIRKDIKTAHIPVIMLTALTEQSNVNSGLQFGANDYIAKPYNQVEMLTRVNNLLMMFQSQREANPLTGLPGNHAIEEDLVRRMDEGDDFCFIYLDLDNFKGFNDTYGYADGDKAIGLLSDILKEQQKRFGVGIFVGHVGGDDFVTITPFELGDEVANAIMHEFDRRSLELLNKDDIERGYLSIVDRQGVEKKIPLMSVTIAVIPKVGGNYSHPGELSDSAFEMKKFGKQTEGSVVVRERRNLPEEHQQDQESEPELHPGSGTMGK